MVREVKINLHDLVYECVNGSGCCNMKLRIG